MRRRKRLVCSSSYSRRALDGDHLGWKVDDLRWRLIEGRYLAFERSVHIPPFPLHHAQSPNLPASRSGSSPLLYKIYLVPSDREGLDLNEMSWLADLSRCIRCLHGRGCSECPVGVSPGSGIHPVMATWTKNFALPPAGADLGSRVLPCSLLPLGRTTRSACSSCGMRLGGRMLDILTT